MTTLSNEKQKFNYPMSRFSPDDLCFLVIKPLCDSALTNPQIPLDLGLQKQNGTRERDLRGTGTKSPN